MDKRIILDRLDKLSFYSREVPSIKWNGKGEGLGLCPFHDDRNPSFSVNGKTGQWKCFGNCEKGRKGGSVFDFVMLQRGVGFTEARRILVAEAGLESQAVKDKKKTLGKIAATYDYTDEAGKLLYQVVRYEPKTFRQRRPDGRGNWIWNLNGVRLVPYRLPELLMAAEVVIAEGEKDVEMLSNWGLTATTNAQGAGKWRQEYAEHLRDKRIAILPDNDDPGRRHAHDVASNLYGIAESVKVVELPGLPHKGDVSEWVKLGDTKEQLSNLIAATPEWKPSMEVPAQVEADAQVEAEAWPEIIKLDDYDSLSVFPTDTLPEWCADMVEAVARVCQVDKGMPGTVCIGVLSACLARKVRVDLTSHREPVNQYLLAIAEPGNRKSPVVSILADPLYRWQQKKAQDMADEIRRAENQDKIRRKRLDRLQKEAADVKNDAERLKAVDEADRLSREIAENPVPRPPICVRDGDISTEKLGDLMAENGERLALISAEGGGFEIMAGLYADGHANLDIYLKGHAGDAWSCERMNRSGRNMANPALTICWTVQDGIIHDIGRKRQFNDRGLLARFLYSKCRPQVGFRERQTEAIPVTISEEYARHITILLDLPDDPDALKLSQEAHEAWNMAYNYFEAELRPGQSMEHIKGWGSKLPGAVARIAGLLHCAEHGRGAYDTPVSVNVVDAAARLGLYFHEHALAVFGLMAQDQSIQAAKLILDYLKRHKPASFTRRDAMRHKNALTSAERVHPGLKVLVDRGYIRLMESSADLYEVNPELYSGNH